VYVSPWALESVYAGIVAYKRAHGGRSPALRDVARGLGVRSTAVAQAYLEQLAVVGRIAPSGFGHGREIALPGERWLAPEGGERVEMTNDRELLTINDVAAAAGLSRQAVEKAIRDGRLTPSARVGKRVRFARADVDAWLARRREGTDRKPRRARPQSGQAGALYACIVAYKRAHGGRSPTHGELVALSGLGSKTAVKYWLLRLAEDGRVGLEGDGARGIVLPGERWLAPGEE
jgi:excisionase family DNA binding protein